MGSRRLAAIVLGQGTVFACGAGAVLAAHHKLYANLVLCIALALGVGGVTLGRLLSPSARPLRSTPAGAATDETARLRAFIDQTPSPLIAIDADGAPRAANRAARALFATDERIVGAPALVEALAATQHATLTLPTPLGPRAFSLSVSDIAGETGVTRLGVLTDIQLDIHAAEAKALRDLLSVLSHEIMNSLTPVSSLAETAAEYLKDQDTPQAQAARQALAVLSRRAGGLGRFVEGYRTLARLPPPVFRRTDIAALAADVADVFRVAWKDVVLEVSCAPPGLAHALDQDLLTQALLNLLTNAAEAAASHSPAPAIRLAIQGRDGRVEITVEDNGPGVPHDLAEDIFLPFVTTKPQCSGVGLNLARQIVLSHGGSIDLAPFDPGRGARFRLVL